MCQDTLMSTPRRLKYFYLSYVIIINHIFHSITHNNSTFDIEILHANIIEDSKNNYYTHINFLST